MRRAIAAAIQMSIWTLQHVQAQEAGDTRAGLVLAAKSARHVTPCRLVKPDRRTPERLRSRPWQVRQG